MRRFWQMCASPSRHWRQCPQLTCISALTKSSGLTARTSSPTRSTVPQNSCPSVTGGLMRPCDQRSEEHTSELQSHSDLHSFPTRRSSDLKIVRLDGAHLVAHALDRAAKFVPQRHRWLDAPLRPAVPPVNVQVRPANRSRLHAH